LLFFIFLFPRRCPEGSYPHLHHRVVSHHVRRKWCRHLQMDLHLLRLVCHHRHLEVHPRDGGVRCVLGVTLDGEGRDIGVWEKTVLQNQIFDFVKLKEMLN
jgi:hypothetical protein